MIRRVGAHVSTAGGFELALDRAQAIGANCAQIFSSSPRVWQSSWQDKLDVQKFFDRQQKTGVLLVFTHALYLVNLASANPASVQKSIAALTSELKFDAAIGGSGVIVHLGSHLGLGWVAVRDQVVSAISEILKNTPEKSNFLIENSAGQKGKVCSDLAEISWLLQQVASPRLGWCFDTCHSFAAGYPLADSGSEQGSAYDKITDLNLWSALKCIHVNDSKGSLGSGLDRHENLGEGQIGLTDFAEFFKKPEVKSLPLILEVPGFEGQGPDQQNIEKLKALL
jgi:deoxyribonuclease-4